MIFPLNANKIEQLEIDPIKKVNGYIWFNTVEKVYKTYVGGTIHIFITDKSFTSGADGLVTLTLLSHQFTVNFVEATKVIIKHNKNSNNFTYNFYDLIDQCTIACSMDVVNENEVTVEFVEPVTGSIFMYFE